MEGQSPDLGPPTAPDRLDRWLAAASPFLAFFISIVASLFRQDGIPKYRTIWAEDGRDFAACAYANNLLDCVTQPYHAWIHLGPRVGAQLAVLAPPDALPLSLTVSAGLLTGLAAAIVTRSVLGASGSWLAGLFAGISLVLTWPAGLEVIGNVTNLPWMLLAAAIIVLVAWWVGHRLGILEFVLVAAAGLSSPLVVVLPAFALVGLALRRPRARAALAVVVACVAVQAFVVITNPHEPPGTQPFDLIATVRAFAGDVLSRGPFGRGRLPPGLLIGIGVGVVSLLAIVQLAFVRARDGRWLDLREDGLRAILVNLGLAGTAVVVFFLTVAIQEALNPPRYAYISATLICAASVFGAALVGRGASGIDPGDGLARRVVSIGSRLALPVLVVVLALGWARSFRLEAKASVGPDVVAEYEATAAECQTGQPSIALRIAPAPRGWMVEIPCDRVIGR